MKRTAIKLIFLPLLIIVTVMVSAQFVYVAYAQDFRVGVTSPSADNVGQILRNIGGGIDFDVIGSADFNSFERLSQYHAVFINCGSHDAVNPQVLRRFVYEGGVVYASDLAGNAVGPAFPGMFSFSTDVSSQTVNNAAITHTSLATHMGRTHMNIVFDLSGWAVITNLSPNATVYIRDNVSGHGDRPLAFSFDYGRGRVFFTSFHNHVQATTDMVNFIEYLVFRIQHFEAERNLRAMADEAGYIFDGSVFGVLNDGETSQAFFYTPQANDFMLLFDVNLGDFVILLFDPLGNVFTTEALGILTDVDLNPEDFHLAFYGFPVELITTEMVVESLGRQGFRVLNPLEGEWSFRVRSYNEDPDSIFAVGLAERPTAALTRAMFAQVLVNLEGVDLTPYFDLPPAFNDVHQDDWFFGAVNWVVQHDIAIGVSATSFAPNSPLTREQMVAMLYNYGQFKEVTLPVIRDGEFTDGNMISNWAFERVMNLYGAGIIGGRPDGSFEPRVTATITEISHIFSNFLPLVGVSYEYDPLAFIYTFAPAADTLAEINDASTAQSAINQTITNLSPQQRQSGEALNIVTLYIENIARRGAGINMPTDGNLNIPALRTGLNIAEQILQNTNETLEAENLSLMRDIRTNINFVVNGQGEIAATFPDDIASVDFDNVTIESDYMAVSINREYIPVGGEISIRYGQPVTVYVAVADPEYYFADDDDPSDSGFEPLTLLSDFWAIFIIMIIIATWGILYINGKKLRLWVVPTFSAIAIAANAAAFTATDNSAVDNEEIEEVFAEIELDAPIPIIYGSGVEVYMTDGIVATLSLPINGYDPHFMVLVNEYGEIQHSRFNPVTETIDARIRSSGSYVLRENAVSFVDIEDKSRLMQDAILRLAAGGIMQGAEEGYFRPDDLITRAEFISSVIMAFDMLDTYAQTTFTDLDSGAWYYHAVATAEYAGLIAGFEDGTFRGGFNIPKDELVVMAADTLARQMDYRFPEDVEYYLSRFLDRPELAYWSEPGIALAAQTNILIQRVDSFFAPRSIKTRGDAAIVLYRLFNRIW